jgi:PIN domain nuclease of toxin-antitoxin system
MNYVTDTPPFVFYAAGQVRKLGRQAHRVFTRAEKRQATVYIPTVCFFELLLLLEDDKLRSSLPFPEWKARIEETGSFIVEPLLWEDIEQARLLPALPDPFDRLIVGMANRIGCSLITRDEKIIASRRVATVW